ncbi:MAG: DUF5329 family protein [Nitrospiria bacterium]
MGGSPHPCGLVRGVIGLAVFLLAGALAQAAELSSAAGTEIASLLNTLVASECQFYRNGSWHTGAEAKEHLQMKLESYAKKGVITSSEEFIARAATRSSLSGQLYKVRCPNHEEEPSAVWLRRELNHLREQER